jgi:hypothetical protein
MFASSLAHRVKLTGQNVQTALQNEIRRDRFILAPPKGLRHIHF